jgi:hypothetical protein
MNLLHRCDNTSGLLAHTHYRPTTLPADSQIQGQRLTSILKVSLQVVLILATFWGMAGCSSSTAKNASQTTPLISVAMTQVPPAAINAGGSATISATVTNDLANAGVNWFATCNGGTSCGSFSPSHTSSGGATTFTAPLAVPPQSTVTINALSSTDQSKYASANVTIISTVTGITITQLPPPTAPSLGSVTVAATVFGDPANLGVDWKANCGGVDCTPAGWHSASGAPTTFVVPSIGQFPTLVGSTVTLTAYATANHSFSASASFIVTGALSVTITQEPPSTMSPNGTATVTAVVNNDPTNAGVTWVVSCGNFSCGSISPTQTASGASATFTAPATVPSPSPIVTITAESTASPVAVYATANVTIAAPVSVTITQQVPTGTIIENTSASLIATVSNDPANAGVDWTVTCGSPSPGACGSFSPAHTASGVATTYTAPAAPPTGSTVTITAASTTQPSQTATQTVTVATSLPPNSLLLGECVFLLSTNNSPDGPFAFGGVFSADGTGNISGGYFDLADTHGNTSQFSPLLSSTYSIGPDGRGQIQLLINPAVLNTAFGVNGSGALTLSVVFVTSTHALLTETDSFANATGTLDLQNAADLAAFRQGAWTNGIYSLELSGVESTAPYPNYFVASAVSIDPSASSYSYITDQSDNGQITSVPFTTASSNISFLRIGYYASFRPLNLGLPTSFSIDGWLVDATHFVVTDYGTPGVIVSGYLTIQPSSPSMSGTYVFTEAGATTAEQPQAAGGIFTCGSTGILDVTPLGGSGLSSQPITATCSGPANGRSLIAISGATTAGISQLAAYPTSDQGLYLIELDGGAGGTSGPSGAGVAQQQNLVPPIASSALQGAYASSFTASNAAGSQVFSAQIISDGVSALSGTGDVNSFDATAAPPATTPSSGATFTGSYTASNNGRFPLTLTITPASGQPTPAITTVPALCYIVDANSCLLLGSDTTAPGTGVLQLQNTGL